MILLQFLQGGMFLLLKGTNRGGAITTHAQADDRSLRGVMAYER